MGGVDDESAAGLARPGVACASGGTVGPAVCLSFDLAWGDLVARSITETQVVGDDEEVAGDGTPHVKGHAQFSAVDEVAVSLLSQRVLAMTGESVRGLEQVLKHGRTSTGKGGDTRP
jgi:hypothetical protein